MDGLHALLSLIVFLHCHEATAYVPVHSCAVDPAGRQPCSTPAVDEQTCLDSDCCWDTTVKQTPVCYTPVTRYWDRCSQRCNGGARQEQNNPAWQIECHAFPCIINQVCQCQSADIVFVLDASKDVQELNFWARKQLIIDTALAYKQIGHDTRFALVLFSNNVLVRFDFDAGYSLEDIHHMNLRVWTSEFISDSRGPDLPLALTTAAQLHTSQGRSYVQHVTVVVSDGRTINGKELPAAIAKLQKGNTRVYAIGRKQIHNMKVIQSLVTAEQNIFTLDDYGSRQMLITGLITEICCQDSIQASVNVRCDDVCDVFVNGQYRTEVVFKQTGIVQLNEAGENLVAVRLRNKLNPRGRYLEVWPTGRRGVSLLSTPAGWRCNTTDQPGWYLTDFDDSHWTQAELPPRIRDQTYTGNRGQQRIWTQGDDWQGFCRAWVTDKCNVTYMPGVSCKSSPTWQDHGKCSNAFDGIMAGRGNEWVTHPKGGERWMNITFPKAFKITGVRIMNRCAFDDQIKDLSLTFNGNITYEMNFACSGYSKASNDCTGVAWTTLTFDPPLESGSLDLSVLELCGSGRRVGLREIQVVANPPCF